MVIVDHDHPALVVNAPGRVVEERPELGRIVVAEHEEEALAGRPEAFVGQIQPFTQSSSHQIDEGEPELKISVLESLFHVASADGVLHPDEDAYLSRVAEIFGLTQGEFRCVRRGFVIDPENPYDVLSIAPRATDKEIKARYRELVKSHHPDALVSKGVPPEFLAAAARRLATITAAYETILAERGKRVERALERSS